MRSGKVDAGLRRVGEEAARSLAAQREAFLARHSALLETHQAVQYQGASVAIPGGFAWREVVALVPFGEVIPLGLEGAREYTHALLEFRVITGRA